MCSGWLLSAVLLLATSLISAQNADDQSANGRITGTVVDEEGQLVDHVNVCTSITSGHHTVINCRASGTKDGQFQLEHLKLGTYNVFATNEAEGYSIQNQSPGRKVTLTADQPWVNVSIRLHPKGSILIGSVRDKASGKLVERASINYHCLDDECAGSTLLTAANSG